MDQENQHSKCVDLERKMVHIKQRMQDACHIGNVNEKQATFCQAVLKLFQSLKALESAPTKKYDFYSLYSPFAVLVKILEDELQCGSDLESCGTVFNFIHKISMTLHGILRTDIQFFQSKDFNAVVHYAPAKLRSFYALWALKMADYYEILGNTDKEQERVEYSFVLSPGMFEQINVQQLLVDGMEEKINRNEQKYRLMLITVPELELYFPKWLLIILAHEISHFVGREIRGRVVRHKIWGEISARILELEIKKFIYQMSKQDMQKKIEQFLKENEYLLDEISDWLRDEEEVEAKEYYRDYHSLASKITIREKYREKGIEHIEEVTSNYVSLLQRYLLKNNQKPTRKQRKFEINVADYCSVLIQIVPLFFQKFQLDILEVLLDVLKYVSGEAFADMMAILTLELSPREYLESFTYGDGSSDIEIIETDISLLEVRICVVIEALRDIVKSNKRNLNCISPRFEREWSGDVYRRVIKSFDKSEFHFLEDEYIFTLLKKYVCHCGNSYIQRFEEEDMAYREVRKKFTSTYQIIAKKSLIESVQEIEDFLENYQKDFEYQYDESILT